MPVETWTDDCRHSAAPVAPMRRCDDLGRQPGPARPCPSMHVLIADDHPLARDGLSRLVRRLDPQARIDEAGDHTAMMSCIDADPPGLVLLDLNMPGMDGLCGLRRLRQAWPALPILVVSGQDDAPTIRAALAAGASGFASKAEPPQRLLHALRLVVDGGVYVPACLLGFFVQATPPGGGVASGLTPRQRDALDLLLLGQPNKLIARGLGVTEGTVKIHVAAILRAFGARNRTEAVLRARELGIGRAA